MKQNHGFTLFEIMVVLSIMGLLLIIGIPKYNAYLKDQEFNTTVNLLKSDLSRAQQSARRVGMMGTLNNPKTIPNEISCVDANGNLIFSHSVPPGILFNVQLPANGQFGTEGSVFLQIPGGISIPFNPNGSISTNGFIGSITVSVNDSSPNKMAVLSLYPQTGAILTAAVTGSGAAANFSGIIGGVPGGATSAGGGGGYGGYRSPPGGASGGGSGQGGVPGGAPSAPADSGTTK